ncbi:hydrolase, carbon-nitrogen family [Renibacterium salmoninarum ATCC 33209]|uniref:Hydrolase, carbon-nitrogen family n=1 Tax=Renibacterium salmoninarum (strain ATCC 33209 / DSM 20767 / JCM 11484 / NBRC 15589 / NCIMB 2235) TaxID=288705 RepID=A9WV78_RENSM|nr:carbon-nitrogen hydrolase family protein [Renibacterium salmoninarum]ABY25099.1 hydrolase, carbon-nitrogen family [Renibacterium salmoninarum ATCC 33209]
MKVSVGQFSPVGDVDGNIEAMRRLAAEAAQDGSELILFPEEAMFTLGKVAGDFRSAVDAGWSVFVQQLTLIAAEHKIAIIAGGYESSGEERPFNTLVAVGSDGAILGTYRKLHLYDAFSYQESKRIMPGNSGLTVVRVGELNVGMMTCYDLRFPELARALAEQDVDLICVPAAWFKGEHKVDHWETLLKARAIENTCWVAAAGSMSPHCIGHSVILDPMGVPAAFLDEEPESLATAEVTVKRIEEVREFLPVLKNRRIKSVREIVPAH